MGWRKGVLKFEQHCRDFLKLTLRDLSRNHLGGLLPLSAKPQRTRVGSIHYKLNWQHISILKGFAITHDLYGTNKSMLRYIFVIKAFSLQTASYVLRLEVFLCYAPSEKLTLRAQVLTKTFLKFDYKFMSWIYTYACTCYLLLVEGYIVNKRFKIPHNS